MGIYLTIIAVAALMILDYYLTIKGQDLYRGVYSKHIKVPTYELNPRFQKTIAARRYNYVHAIAVVLVCAFIYGLHWLTINEFVQEGAFALSQGMILSMFIYINARHIQNILLFRKLNQNQSWLSGVLKQKHEFSLYSAKVHAIGAGLILLALWSIQPSWFLFGFALGPLAIARKHVKWEKK